MKKSRTGGSAPPLIKNKRVHWHSLCNLKNRRGQFYLIAAIALIVIFVGFAVVSNYASSEQNPSISYLRDEILIESGKVIDYTAYNQLNFTQIQSTLSDFSERYINDSQEDNFYFIFGNATNMTFMARQSDSSNVTLNGVDYTNILGTGQIYSQSFQPATNNETMGIDGNMYSFPLTAGENFDFIISNKRGGQTYTATSQ